MTHIRGMNDVHAEFIAHLSQTDPILCHQVRANGPLELPDADPHFRALCRAIIGQQLSTKAAHTIFTRFWNWVEMTLPMTQISEEHPTALAERIVRASPEELRAVGISAQKATYLMAMSQAWLKDSGTFLQLDQLSDAQVVDVLCSVKGIGEWTAQMFLIFTLKRPDVFAPGDLGIKKAIEHLYGVPMASSRQVFEAHAANWSPHRSLACLHLWRTSDALQRQPK